MFINMLIQLYLVGTMLLYILRVKLPISYRIYSGLAGLSLLVYNQIFYLPYESELLLKGIAVSNGPYFSFYRIAQLNQLYIFPTLALLIVVMALFIVLYKPLQIFNK